MDSLTLRVVSWTEDNIDSVSLLMFKESKLCQVERFICSFRTQTFPLNFIQSHRKQVCLKNEAYYHS